MSGVTSAGFEIKTRAEITAAVEAALKAQSAFGPDVDLTPESALGPVVSVFVDQLYIRWQGLEDVYFALYIDTAEGANLERAVALGGLSRKAASKAIVELAISGIAGTVVPLGFQGQTATGEAFETLAAGTIAAVEGYQAVSSTPVDFSGSTVPGIAAQTYDLDVTIDGGGLNQLTLVINLTDTWDIIVTGLQSALRVATGSTETISILGGEVRVTSATTGTSSTVLVAAGTAGSGGGDLLAAIDAQIANMVTTIEVAVDGSAGRLDADSQAVVAGVDGNVGAATITTIGTPAAGVTGVNNVLAATGGDALETDVELRARYQARGSSGGSSANAIQAELNALDSVITAKCFENNTDAVDGAGLPPHSIEAVVDGGTDAEIGDILLNFKAAGIETYGGNSTTVVDNAGISRTFKFTRPAYVDIYVDVDITSNAAWDSTYAATVKARVADVVGGTSGGVTYEGNGIDADVFSWQVIANLDGILGIDLVSVDVENVTPPTQKIHVITRGQRARTDDAKIVVTVV